MRSARFLRGESSQGRKIHRNVRPSSRASSRRPQSLSYAAMPALQTTTTTTHTSPPHFNPHLALSPFVKTSDRMLSFFFHLSVTSFNLATLFFLFEVAPSILQNAVRCAPQLLQLLPFHLVACQPINRIPRSSPVRRCHVRICLLASQTTSNLLRMFSVLWSESEHIPTLVWLSGCS